MVITIIGILIALLLPAVQAAREAARRMQCSNNLKQIGLALHGYHQSHDMLPFGSGGFAYTKDGAVTGTWAAFILPYLEQQNVYNLFNFNYDMNTPQNAQAVTTVVTTYICPSDPLSNSPINTHPISGDPVPQVLRLWYPGCMGPTHVDTCTGFCANQSPSAGNYCCQGYSFGSIPSPDGSIPAGTFAGMFCRCTVGIRFAQVTDGLSNTLMCGETLPGDCGFNGAYAPNFPVATTITPLNIMEADNGDTTLYPRTCGFKSLHPGGANFVAGDGSVHFLSQNIDYRLYNNLGTRAGNEVVSVP